MLTTYFFVLKVFIVKFHTGWFNFGNDYQTHGLQRLLIIYYTDLITVKHFYSRIRMYIIIKNEPNAVTSSPRCHLDVKQQLWYNKWKTRCSCMDCVRSHAQAQPMSYLLLIPAIGRPTPNDVMCMRCMCSGGGKHIKIDLFRTYFCLKILFQTSRLVNYARDKIMLLSPRQSPLNSHHFIMALHGSRFAVKSNTNVYCT